MENNKNIYECLLQKIHEQIQNDPHGAEKNDSFNIFKVLGITDKEVLICRLLGDLLDPRGSHGLKEKPLLLFMKQLHLENSFSLDEIDKAYIVLEETIDNERRIDIVIYTGNSVIPIEVKIWAGDQDSQLYDYYQYFYKSMYNKQNFKIYYLTPNGHNPSEISISDSEKNQRLTTEQYQCLSFKEDVSKWIDNILKSCSNQVGTILKQFKEVINDMCSKDEILQNIKEVINIEDGQFESNSYMKALIYILSANKENELWQMIRKEYLRKNLKFDKNKYELEEILDDEKGYAVFSVKALTSGKNIAWICIETNLYITAETLKEGFAVQSEWKKGDNYIWRYLNPNGSNKKFNLKDPNPSILTDTPIDIESLLEQIEL